MTRSSTRTTKPGPAKSNVQVTPEEGRIDDTAKKPVNLEVETPSEEPVAASAGLAAEKIQADIRDKLSNRTVEENIFVPSNPVALEKAAEQIAEESGFEYNRGTAIGARLMARAQKRV